MLALLGLFAIIIIAITIIRIGAIALELTGLSPEISAFQAQSAFSGTGFSTDESESIVSHPVRRRIVRLLILTGNAGITSIIAALILTFLGESTLALSARILVLLVGLIIIFLLSRSKLIYKGMEKIIKKALSQHTSLSLLDYQEILGLRKGYTVSTIKVKKITGWWENNCMTLICLLKAY